MNKTLSEMLLLLAALLAVSSGALGQDDGDDPPPAPRRIKQPIENGVKFLKQANLAHGGTTLDNLKTLRLIGSANIKNIYYKAKVFVDLSNQKARLELSDNQDFHLVSQIENQSGWVYETNTKNKKYRKLTKSNNELLIELFQFINSGIFRLRSHIINKIVVISFESDQKKNEKSMRVFINKRLFDWVFNEKDILVRENFVKTNILSPYDIEMNLYDGFQTIDGIVFPKNTLRVLINYSKDVPNIYFNWSSIEVNPKFTASDWAVPN